MDGCIKKIGYSVCWYYFILLVAKYFNLLIINKLILKKFNAKYCK